MPHSVICFTIPSTWNYSAIITFIPIGHPTFIIIKQDFKKDHSKSSMYLQFMEIKPISMGSPVLWVVKLLMKTNQIYYYKLILMASREPR